VALPYNQRTHSCGQLRESDIGQSVLLAGWVNNYRDHGGMVFIDLRDRDGVTQLKFNPDTDPVAHKVAGKLRNEYVIAIRGEVAGRGENVNPHRPTGTIEVNVHEADLLSEADTPPFDVSESPNPEKAEDEKRQLPNEDLRLTHRYLDLRRPSVQRVFKTRHKLLKTMRDFFDEEGFLEIETPVLTKSTPEGARDYLVPSRVQQGTFYALPQSPQLFKQMFMVAGFDKYAQIVRCFRDEDLRADRQPEFTQLDVEMSFVQAEDVMSTIERCFARVFKNILGVDIQTPLQRMPYREAMERYGSDAPDTRFGLELQDITEIVKATDFGVFANAIKAGGVVKCIVAPGGESLTRKVTDGLTEEIQGMGGGGLPVTKVTQGKDGVEFATGIAKFMQPFAEAICEATGAKVGDAIFFMPGPLKDAYKFLGFMRDRLAEVMGLIPADQWNLLWITEFPLVEWDEGTGRWYSTHHPFTAPVDEDVDKLESEPGHIRSKAYDLVLNGMEMAGGSIRIHRRDIQKRVFKLLGITDEEAQAKFKFLMEALRFGAPPHGGIAAGVDRWTMVLEKQESLRDVIAFPKTQRAVCPLTDAPGDVAAEQLRELGLDFSAELKAKKTTPIGRSELNTGEHIHKHGKS
jgi:aspartyl-tRNA synthetase